jgi:RNA polymerase sigma-70 factor (sigma-E family)
MARRHIWLQYCEPPAHHPFGCTAQRALTSRATTLVMQRGSPGCELITAWVWGRWDRSNHAARGGRTRRYDMTPGEPGGAPTRPIHVTETLVADTALGSVPADWDADRAVTALYSTHYRSLVRLAALLVRDVATAEEVVQDSFVAMHGGWRRLRDSEKALSYLRQSVVNRSRSVLRHRVVVDRNAPKPSPDMPSAEHGAIVLLERSAVVSALRTLPPRQREALVLRYYGDMSEAQIADIMGISRGAVKSHTARAMSALRSVLEREA